MATIPKMELALTSTGRLIMTGTGQIFTPREQEQAATIVLQGIANQYGVENGHPMPVVVIPAKDWNDIVRKASGN